MNGKLGWMTGMATAGFAFIIPINFIGESFGEPVAIAIDVCSARDSSLLCQFFLNVCLRRRKESALCTKR
jgi:hypothetical protein